MPRPQGTWRSSTPRETRAAARLSRAPRGAPRRILVVAARGAELLDAIGPYQVFVTANTLARAAHPERPAAYRVEIVSLTRGTRLSANCGLRISAHLSYTRVRGPIDTLLVAGGRDAEENLTSAAAVHWLRVSAERARRVGSVCTGALLLGRTGLLDERRVTTHWNWCSQLAQRCPRARVDPDPIFIRDGKIATSAGVTAGMDLALALVEEDHGARLALQVARQLVLYLRRPGGQSQFSAALALQLSEREPLAELHAWVLEHLNHPLDVAALAARVHMSPRNFARVFSREMHTTPGKFVERLRVESARRRLEETRRSLKQIAQECGFLSVARMRSVFQRAVGVPPARYRQHFRSARG
jgi:transcriptional regulator GlxA family with amidase domain